MQETASDSSHSHSWLITVGAAFQGRCVSSVELTGFQRPHHHHHHCRLEVEAILWPHLFPLKTQPLCFETLFLCVSLRFEAVVSPTDLNTLTGNVLSQTFGAQHRSSHSAPCDSWTPPLQACAGCNPGCHPEAYKHPSWGRQRVLST